MVLNFECAIDEACLISMYTMFSFVNSSRALILRVDIATARDLDSAICIQEFSTSSVKRFVLKNFQLQV